MSRLLRWVKGTSDGLLQKWLLPDQKVDNQWGYYGELLDDLNQAHLDLGSSGLTEKVQTLKLEVRYILPYAAASGLLTVEEHYGKTKKRFLGSKVRRIKQRFRMGECHEGLDDFVDHMTERTLLVKPDASVFYQSASVSEYDWQKCADCVLDNLKYVQSLDAKHTVPVIEILRTIEERLRFLTTFRVLVGKWKFEDHSTKAELDTVYQQTNSGFREAAYVFRLLVQGCVDPSGAQAMHLELSVLLQKVDHCHQQAKLVYFDILKELGLSSSETYHVKAESLCRFIDCLQGSLTEVLMSSHSLIESKDQELKAIRSEIEFLRIMLMDATEKPLEDGKLDDIFTHVDALVHETESVVSSLSKEPENQDYHETLLEGLEVIEKVKETRLEIREVNRQNVMPVHYSIDDLLSCFGTLLSQDIWTELLFLQIFLRCTGRWCIAHPLLGSIRIHIEKGVCDAWWELRCFVFMKPKIGKADKVLESLCSQMLDCIVTNNSIKEVCAEIKVLKYSTLSSPMSQKFGLETADALSTNLSNLDACNLDSFAIMRSQLDDEIKFLGLLRVISAMLYTNDKSRIELLTHLEDLTERAACLSYLQLVEGETEKTMPINELLLQIREPDMRNIYHQFINSAVWELADFKRPADEVMLPAVRFLMQNLMELEYSDGDPRDLNHFDAETVQKELTVLKCILTDALLQYSEQDELDVLLEYIGTGIYEAGILFCCFSSKKFQGNSAPFNVVEIVDRLKEAVRQAYFKFVKLSPSKLSMCELGYLDILLANVTEKFEGRLDCAASIMHDIALLTDELRKCGLLLENKEIKHNEQRNFKDLKARILNVAYKVENVIDTFAVVPDWYFKMLLCDVTKEVQLTTAEITMTHLIQNVVVSDADGLTKEALKRKDKEVAECFKDETTMPKQEDAVMIGFEDEEQELLKQLCRASQQLEVVTIVGMPGLGKTTLAMKVYEGLERSFHTRAWCYVSENFQPKELLRDIINQINGPNRINNDMNIEDLAQNLYQSLLKKKDYLIVLDDVWDIKAWNMLNRCFPHSNNNGGKILLTSRSASIGQEASGDGSCVELQPLPIEKSWHLLEQRVFGTRTYPERFKILGERIARKTGGMPFSIVVTAGVLKNIEEDVDKWKQVEKSLDSFVENQDGFLSKLELSYDHLPVRLKQCFLYCGTFLRGKQISRQKLVDLWVAERFVDKTYQEQCLEDVAECYLRDLVDRSLLMVTKKSSGKRIQSCRMNDYLRDFCLQKAEEEKFLHVAHRWDSVPRWHRRLCFRRAALYRVFTESLPSTAHTRSLSFNPYLVDLEPHIVIEFKISFDFEKYKFLKMLDMEGINMGDKFPESITHLTLLTYLAVQGRVDHIPMSIGKLSNLETFIFICKTGSSVGVPCNIFDLKKLRHLRVDDSADLISNETSSSMDCLQSLTNPVLQSGEMCQEIIARLPNLQKLRCIFRECWTEVINCNVFPDMVSLSHLQQLRVMYSGVPRHPCRFSFPSTLKKLTLSKFQLPWSEMDTIAELPQLETLKLKDDAFKGRKWVTNAEYPNLKYLRLEELDIEEWETSEDCFPSLELLFVKCCQQLTSLPSDLRLVDTLLGIEVHQCRLSVAETANEIEKCQRNSGNKDFKSKSSCIGLDLTEEVSGGSTKFEGIKLMDLVSVVFDPFGMGSDMGP